MLNAFLHFKKNFNLSLVLEKKQKTRLAHRVNGQSRMVNTSFKEFGGLIKLIQAWPEK